MTSFIACSACQRYIRHDEPECPFCDSAIGALLPVASDPSAPVTAPAFVSASKGRSRAAAFALRAAVVAGTVPAVTACGSDGTRQRPTDRDPNGMGGSASMPEPPPRGEPIELADAGAPVPPEPEPDGGFVPVPIYGGVFPDPMSRARV